jgi:tetratricopeptide (TPR) repeat protein
MSRTMRSVFVSIVVVVVALAGGCLEKAGVGRAADPSKAEGPAPWGSATTNQELEKKVALLNDIMDGKLAPVDIPARVEKDWPNLTADERKKSLEGITDLVEDLKRSGKQGTVIPAGPDRDMALAQLYFSERRFIEAATLLSGILDKNPRYPSARNLLARCFFFLQNRDRTIAELEFVLRDPEQQKDRNEVLDALFLMGAAVAETPGMSRENMEKGKNAWETYLKLAPDSPQKTQVEKGLLDIEAGLRGEGRLAQPLVPKQSEGDASAPTNVMGGAKSLEGDQPAPMGPGSAPSTEREDRVGQLKPDASPAEHALAEGLDALDGKDFATASAKLAEASQSLSGRPLSEARVGIARIDVQTGKVDDGLKLYGEVIKVDPDFMPAWHYLGMAHMMSGDPAQAVQAWQKILDKDPAYAAKFHLDQRIEVAKRMSGR